MVAKRLGLVDFAVAHQADAHAQVAASHAEIDVLAVGGSPRVVFLEFGGTVLADVECTGVSP